MSHRREQENDQIQVVNVPHNEDNLDAVEQADIYYKYSGALNCANPKSSYGNGTLLNRNSDYSNAETILKLQKDTKKFSRLILGFKKHGDTIQTLKEKKYHYTGGNERGVNYGFHGLFINPKTKNTGNIKWNIRNAGGDIMKMRPEECDHCICGHWIKTLCYVSNGDLTHTYILGNCCIHLLDGLLPLFKCLKCNEMNRPTNKKSLNVDICNKCRTIKSYFETEVLVELKKTIKEVEPKPITEKEIRIYNKRSIRRIKRNVFPLIFNELLVKVKPIPPRIFDWTNIFNGVVQNIKESVRLINPEVFTQITRPTQITQITNCNDCGKPSKYFRCWGCKVIFDRGDDEPQCLDCGLEIEPQYQRCYKHNKIYWASRR